MARILIIEDERPLADLLAGILEREGHEVLAAANAAEGIGQAMAHRPDVVIAAWMLKDRVHGGEAACRIRTACPHVKIIIITGHLEVALRARSWCDCINEVLEKPFHSERLVAAVRRLLSEEKPFLAEVC
jgi:DNA-binding response OmpR family regulator